MKILIFSSLFPPEIGGVQNVTYNLAQQFKSYGHDVVVLTSLKLADLATDSSLLKLFKVATPLYLFKDLKVKKLFMSLPRSIFGYLSFPYRYAMATIYTTLFIKKIKPSIVNFHFPDDSIYYFFAVSKIIKFPFIINIHGNELHVFSKNKIYKLILKNLLKKSKKVIVNSNYMKTKLIKTFKELNSQKVEIINNGLNLSKFSNLGDREIALKKNSYYLYVGRLDYKKGLDILIKTYNKIGHKLKRNLVIVGGDSVGNSSHGGSNLEEYKKMATSNKILFEGWVDPSIVPYYFKNAYYSVFPSRNEPFGLVGIESMASGTPILASSGGFEEIINHTQGGILFKPKSVKQLENLLLRVDSKPGIREALAVKALKSVTDYDWGKKSLEYLAVFESAKKAL